MQSTGVAAVTAFTAHREWASRPPDERFASVSSLYEAARARRERHRRADHRDRTRSEQKRRPTTRLRYASRRARSRRSPTGASSSSPA